MSDIHVVVKNDTLGHIAKRYQVPLATLIEINQIRNPNRLEIGQRIVLRKAKVLGFQALFLDLDRNPIRFQPYQFEFAGKVRKGRTGPDGLTDRIETDSPKDPVRILVARLDQSMKEITTVLSGYGDKLVTLVSPSVKVEGRTEQHNPPAGPKKATPLFDSSKPQAPTTGKKDLGPVATPTKARDGSPVVKVEGDIPELDLFLGEYVGGSLSDADIIAAATSLKCEPGLIFAIAKQESSHSSFFKLGKRTIPKILYERHWFRKLTKPNKKTPSPYEAKYPDICGPAYHLTTVKKKVVLDRVTMLPPVADDVYGAQGKHQYKRLVKAFQLDQSAALQSCSWGKFQIMGFNYKNAGFKDVFAFVKAMSAGDAEHMKAFLKFAKSNPILLSGLQNKNFEKIAEGHNGGSWKKINPHYASNIEKFYLEYQKNAGKK